MTVLLIGFRIGAAKALENRNIPYIIWSESELKNSRQSIQNIIGKFPTKKDCIVKYAELFSDVTHVIAATEAAVVPASRLRRWLDLYRNKDSVITHCTDKLEMKKYLSKHQIPMTKFKSSKGKTAQEIVGSLGLPIVNKVKLSSGGRGVSFLNTLEEVELYLDKVSYFEKPIRGTEGSIESFVKDGEVLFTNITQYFKNGACNILPGNYSEEIKEKIHELNNNVLKALKLKWGMTHLEYYIQESGEILFGEVALRPPGGYIMDAMKLAYHQNFWDVFVAIEIGDQNIKFNELKYYASSIVIHPGQGNVTDVLGVEEIQGLSSIHKFSLKIEKGDILTTREGVGQDYGYLLLKNEKLDHLQSDIKFFYDNFDVQFK